MDLEKINQSVQVAGAAAVQRRTQLAKLASLSIPSGQLAKLTLAKYTGYRASQLPKLILGVSVRYIRYV